MVSDAVCQKRAHIATKVMPIKRLRFRTYGIEAFFSKPGLSKNSLAQVGIKIYINVNTDSYLRKTGF